MSRNFLCVFSTAVILVGILISNAHPQDLLSEQASQQKQILDLRRDVDELQRTVDVLKRLIPRQALSPVESTKEISKSSRKPIKPTVALSDTDRQKIKGEICQDVSLFFDTVDQALKMPDDSQAQKAMNRAVAKLHGALDKHVPDQSLRKVMDYAEAIAWDTYSAVQFRYSSAGNADFLDTLKEAREKYKIKCSDN